MIKKSSVNSSEEKGISNFKYEATKSTVSERIQLVDKNVFQGRHVNEFSLSELKKVITCRMFLKENTDAVGVFEKVKVRLVAAGEHLQDRGSPTSSTTVVVVAALAAMFAMR